ncbi:MULTISPECIES: FAD-dependent oxidoreductase [Amycolatopsis]|uniref:FAD-dependent oxidoreductase n=1 Tax=Amycolatopsis TaxID=1813 RepID=UPI000B8B31A5|nr:MULTISPECIES: FAD-dependent oxidoreductase [Amycolatopsis]OXM61989.1 monooxygenase [Amycolatopsis sp. KNN50.9b]
MTTAHDHETDVLIVGGGVTGLSTALFLTRLGIRPLLVERHPSTAIMPQARAVNPRTMEIYRALGLEAEILGRQSILVDYPEMIGGETLAGEERFRMDLLTHVRPSPDLSPVDWAMIDQDELERVLHAHAVREGADVRFGSELVDLSTADDGVTATVRENSGGAEYRVRARYLVAADGNRAGVRRRLGIGVDQPGPTDHAVYCIFDADLTEPLRSRRFLLAYLDRPTTGTVLVPLRRFGRWMLGVPYHPERGERAEDFTEERCAELARAAVGIPGLELTLVPPVPGWPQKISHSTGGGWVAHRFRSGRVFFAGDAAHVFPPAGSYGANTAIGDAHNLSWKLAAVLHGQAGPALLDTYEPERRPVAQLSLGQALRLLRARHEGTEEELTGIDDLTMIFGYRYESAAVAGERPAPAEPVENPRTPSGRPGHRAPHVWLSRNGRRISTLDLFDGTFTLLTGPDGAEWAAAAKTAAATLGVEVTVHHIGPGLEDTAARWSACYGVTSSGATLVRPDGFIAWRAPEPPPRPDHELTRVLTALLAPEPGVTVPSREPGDRLV